MQNASKEQSGSNEKNPNDKTTHYAIRNSTITVDFDKPDEASVFDYFKSVELIPLETNQDVLIGQLRKIIFHNGRYYTFDRQQQTVHVFDDKGKFIFKIDGRGQGPDEYPSLDDMPAFRMNRAVIRQKE
ncbi:MAG: 6-bladed beta-propeller [Tannerella sp.]|nr:6-bladed beta-propeller [Tannerella sp.]